MPIRSSPSARRGGGGRVADDKPKTDRHHLRAGPTRNSPANENPTKIYRDIGVGRHSVSWGGGANQQTSIILIHLVGCRRIYPRAMNSKLRKSLTVGSCFLCSIGSLFQLNWPG
jgi:hypothetical protein